MSRNRSTLLPEPSPMELEDRWAQWLGGFKPGSVISCALGSHNFPEKDQFQELLLGFERTGLSCLAALKPPLGAATIEEALPEGFQGRVGGRGVVQGGWVPQPSILSHWESLMSDPQIVLVPELSDQMFRARLLAEELKVAVVVENIVPYILQYLNAMTLIMKFIHYFYSIYIYIK